MVDRPGMGAPHRLLRERRYQPGTPREGACSKPGGARWTRWVAHRPIKPRVPGGAERLGADEPSRDPGAEVRCAPGHAVSRGEVERALQLFPDIERSRILFTPNFAARDEYAWALAQGLRDPARMAWLLQELAKTEHPTSCPHGRPIALLYSWKDIQRAFHRI